MVLSRRYCLGRGRPNRLRARRKGPVLMHVARLAIAASLFTIIVCSLPEPASAQGVTGSAMTGTVSEEGSGTPIAGAFIELKNTATGYALTALTDVDGTYFIDNIAPGGPYVLTVTSGAYKPARMSGIQLQLGQRLQLDQVMSMSNEEIVIVDRLDPLK